MKRILSLILVLATVLSTVIMSHPASAEPSFNDTDGHWATEAIEYVVDAGLMNGVGDGSSFAPNMNLTRGMVVTVLYRANGSPKITFKGIFLDVSKGMYYANAAEWAYNNGIVTGTGRDDWGDPYFSPDRDITRQELATMFARYAAFKYVDTSKKNADISGYPDVASVADWATDTIKWTVGVGLITGKSNGGKTTLSPLDKASRAEFATIMQRYDSKLREFDYVLNYSTPTLISEYTEQPYPLVENADVYVAVDGNDKNPGTLDKPLATFAAAKAKVRELKKTAKDEIVVAFKAGKYGKLDNLTFTEEDGGSESVPVTYCKYGDGDVIFSNGIIIEESSFTAITDAEKELFPAESTSMIKKMSLEGMLPGELKVSNYLFSEVDGLIWLARDLNKNNQGQDIYYSNMVTESSDRMNSIKLLGKLPSHVESFKTLDGLMIKGMLCTGYTFNRFDIKGYNKETQELIADIDKYENIMPDMSEGKFSGFAVAGRMDTRIFFYNLAEFMDAQGEYWVDRENEMLYVFNPRGRYTFCTDGTMMTLEEGADHISFIGLEFNGCADTMVICYSNYLTFDRCTFANIGGHYGIRADGVNHFNLINSDMHNFVDGGLYLISDADRDFIVPAGNVIRNNAFYDFGLSEYWSNGVRVKNDVGCLIEHNEFRNGAHGGLRYDDCIDTLIQYNVFDSLMRTTQDYGAIYSIWCTIYRGNVVRFNLFTNITGTAAQIGAAAFGFYVDNNTSGVEIYGNIFHNGGIWGVMLHDGRDNSIHDNVFINTIHDNIGSGLVGCSEGMSKYVDENGQLTELSGWPYTPWMSDMELLPKEGDANYDLWYERWSLMFNYHYDVSRLDEVECAFRNVNYIENNYTFGFETSIDDNSILEQYGVVEGNVQLTLDDNPLFVNPSIGDYSIREDADFLKIPYEQIGRY